MRRCFLVLGLLAFAIAACGPSKPATTNTQNLVVTNGGPAAEFQLPVATSTRFGPDPGPMPVGLRPAGAGDPVAGLHLSEAELKEKFDAALAEAIGLLADRKLGEALTAFEAARSFRDDEMVKQAIAKLKSRIEQETAAERIVADIQAILDDGKADEAAKLATEALQQFGNTDAAAALTKLAQQANSVVSVQSDDKKGRFVKFKEDYETALKDKNLRGVVLALEQALQNGDDDELKQKLDESRAALTKFDELRARAAELRRDPNQLDDAVISLKEAAKIWESPAVQQDLDDCQFALQNRRERLAVAEFETRGEIGIPQAGAFVADEILPAFKGKYDLVERSQFAKIVEEMKLENGLTDDELARQKVGQAAKVRYLVVGSITPVAGITVQARLVDVKTGLIVQTARITAANQDELVQRLPQLGQQLLMTDEEKQKFEQIQLKDAAPIEVVKADNDVEFPAAPDLPGDIPPPAIMPPKLAPPAQPANLQPAQFNNLPPPPELGQPMPVVVLPAERELLFRRRAAVVALELGDNLFRRGRFRDAMVQFEFGLNLFPENRGIRLRAERCRPLLPPVAVLPVMRSRVAVLDFLTFGDANVVPPYLGPWAAEQIAPYLAPQYEAVDRISLYYWMGRLGVTPADLLNDPVARQYLGRALGVRYFLFGNLVQTLSFDVYTYLVDAEFGFMASGARIHVRGELELKLRLSEVAWLTKMPPDERLRVERDTAVWEQLIAELREHQRVGRFQQCLAACDKALKLRPGNVEVLVIRQNVERRAELDAMNSARQQSLDAQQQFFARVQIGQVTLVRNAELAREKAALFAAGPDADRRRIAGQRETAAVTLTKQGQLAIQGKRFGAAIQFYESAVALAPTDANYRELALARAKAEETERANAAETAAAREAAIRRQREAELTQARAQLVAERQQHAAEEASRRKFLEDRDKAEYTRLMDLAQRLSAEGKIGQAVAMAQKAKQLRQTPEAERLVTQLLVEEAKANAERGGAAARAELERQLAAEREARVKAELEAKANRDRYEQILALANKALQDQKYDAAIEQFNAAKKIHVTDVVLAGLQRAEAARNAAVARTEADRRRIEDQQKQISNLKQQLADAETALAAKEFEKSIALYRAAKAVAPNDVAVLTGLTKAEQLRDQAVLITRRSKEEADKKVQFDSFLANGKTNLERKQYTAAVLALGQALKLNPNHAETKQLLADAQAKADTSPAVTAELQRKKEQYEALMSDGNRALANKQYDAAQRAFQQALALVPKDALANSRAEETLLARLEANKSGDVRLQLRLVRDALAAGKVKDAETAYKKADGLQPKDPELVKALAEAGKALDAARQKSAAVTVQLNAVQVALAGGKLDDAVKAYREAVKIDPNNPDVIKALSDIRTAQDKPARTATDPAKEREARFADLVAKGQAALTAKKADDAIRFLTDANGIKPNDPTVRALLAQATQMRDAANAGAAAMARDKQVKQLVADARAAIAARKLADAAKLLDQAAALAPKDAAVVQAQTELKTAEGAMAAETNKKREFDRLMLQARTAMAAKKYDDAMKNYTAALALYPTDAEATKGLADAKKAAETKPAPAPVPMPTAKPPLYTKQMEAGQTAEKAGRYDQALVAYQTALRALPGDKAANSKVEFCQAMLDGAKAMQARKFPDAVKAYEAALKLFPDDQTAKLALQKAKMAK